MADPGFQTQDIRFGSGGLNLHLEPDLLPPEQLRQMKNLVRLRTGGVTVRDGLDLFMSGSYSLPHHSMMRLNTGFADTGASFMRVVGAGENVYQGKGDLLLMNLVSSGWSGRPLVMIPAKPFLNGQDFAVIGDTLKMRQIQKTGPETASEFPLGLPAPTQTPSVSLNPQDSVLIDNFGDAGWSNNQGSGALPPINAVAPGIIGNATAFTTTGAGSDNTSYFQYWGKANPQNLAGSFSDQDLIEFYMMIDFPQRVAEVKIYFVLGDFDDAALPGADPVSNGNFYVKGFRPSDFAPTLSQFDTALDAGKAKRGADILTQGLTDEARDKRTGPIEVVTGAREGIRFTQQVTSPGSNQWTHFGTIGIPLRRGDFLRGGTDTSLTWGDVSGMVISMQIVGGLPQDQQNVNLSMDEMSLVGGAGPDTTPIGYSAYDYRFTNYNTITGDESNPSPEMNAGDFVDAARQSISVNPPAFGAGYAHQRFYRRGGTLVNDWYFVGENGSDGGVFTDDLSDDEIQAAGTLELDNDQPVTSVDFDGNTVLGQPLPAIFLVDDVMCGCGDANRPGFLYYSKPGKYGSWPSANQLEVCPGSERLEIGFQYGGQGFVFSREALYALQSQQGILFSTPTACSRGIVNRWALASTPNGVAFVSWDGIFVTGGSNELSITDEWVGELFRADYSGTLAVIDWEDLHNLRLDFHQGELWFYFVDTTGANRSLVYSFRDKYWREATWQPGYGTFGYSETQETGIRVHMIGGQGGIFTCGASNNFDQTVNSSGAVTNHKVDYDAICGALDQGIPRKKKLYGDLVLDVDRKIDDSFTVQTIYNNGVTTLTPTEGPTLGAGSAFGHTSTGQVQNKPPYFSSSLFFPAGNPGRLRYTYDLKDAAGSHGPQVAYNCAIRIFGSCYPGQTTRHTIYYAGLSYAVQPDTVVERATNWDPVGRLTQKWFKGVVIEYEYDSNQFTQNEVPNYNADIYGDDATTPAASVRLNPYFDTYDADPRASAAPQGSWEAGRGQRKLVQNAFEPFLAHHVRIVLRGGTGFKSSILEAPEPVGIRIHNVQWICDEEPLYLQRWQTQIINHGINGWHTPLYAQITMKIPPIDFQVEDELPFDVFLNRVTLQVEGYDQGEWLLGEGGGASNVKTYTIPAVRSKLTTIVPPPPILEDQFLPFPQKRTYFVPFEATKAIAYRYTFTIEPKSTGIENKFWLYREESAVWVMPWGGGRAIKTHPFGNDDLDLVRAMNSAEGVAVMPGGGTGSGEGRG